MTSQVHIVGAGLIGASLGIGLTAEGWSVTLDDADPETARLARSLGAGGVTVLLSSHILAEVQQVCTSATILGNGRTLASGSVADLIGTGTTQRVVTPDPTAARAALQAAGLTVVGEDGPALVVDTPDAARVTRVLGEAGVWLTELGPVRADLEAIFLELTEGEHLGGHMAWPADGGQA